MPLKEVHYIKCVASDTVRVEKQLCKSIVNIKTLKYHLWGGTNVTYMLSLYCQFNVNSICVQINRLETDKQSDPKGCAAHAIYRLEAQWAVILCQHYVCHGTDSPTSQNQPYHGLNFISCLSYML